MLSPLFKNRLSFFSDSLFLPNRQSDKGNPVGRKTFNIFRSKCCVVQQINSDYHRSNAQLSLHDKWTRTVNFLWCCFVLLSFTTVQSHSFNSHFEITATRLWNQFNGLLLFIVWRGLCIWKVSHCMLQTKYNTRNEIQFITMKKKYPKKTNAIENEPNMASAAAKSDANEIKRFEL